MKIKTFRTEHAFERWMRTNHDRASEVWIRIHKKSSGLPTITPAQALDAFKQRARVKLLGHAFESINYAKLHKLVNFTPAQETRIQAGEQALYDSIVKLRAHDWGFLRRTLGDKFISDVVIALGHAARAMKLLTPDNPDTLA